MYFIGQGIDNHKLVKKINSTIILGGFKFKSNYKIIAHSDGDVVLHSVSNALLGSLCLGDIGDYFKDNDSKNKNISSVKILNFCLAQLKKQKLKINNIDLTIQCENIIFNNIKLNIKKNLIKLLDCKFINVKATRFEYKSDLITVHCSLLIK
jgi:2-C-methyl-D-erythritol 2,4-cyclodiphosphate synthase